jgi:L-iditol 2-dehydrogenase
MATRMLFPARAAFRIPEVLSATSAALVEPTAVALNAVRRVPLAGRSVLVLGAGTIGLLVAQCARAVGAEPICLADPVGARRDVTSEVGFDAFVALTRNLDADVASLRSHFNDEIDVMIVCTGALDALSLAVGAVRPGGALIVLGLFGRSQVGIDLDSVVVRDISLYGVLGSPHTWPDAIALLATGAVKVDPLLAQPVPLSHVGALMSDLRNRGGSITKLLVGPQLAD